MKMEAICPSETLVVAYKTIGSHNTAARDTYTHSRETLTSCTNTSVMITDITAENRTH
jgi:hypothetical protein